MQSLDTNTLLRLVLNDDPRRAGQVQALLTDSHRNSFVVADAVFFEMAWILSSRRYQLNRQDIADCLLQITEISQIMCSRELIRRVVPLYVKHPRLSFLDIWLALAAELNQAVPLVTYDKALAKAMPRQTKLLAI